MPVKFQKETEILKAGSRPEEVLFLLKGSVMNVASNRILPPGSIFGEVDIIFKRERLDSYLAISDVYLLKYEIQVFQQILQDFPNIRDEVTLIATQREKMRVMYMRSDSMHRT